jgi:membrane-bound lytic murein transglycosylase B
MAQQRFGVFRALAEVRFGAARLALCCVTLFCSAVAAAESGYLQRAEVRSYIEELVADHGFSRVALEEIFSQAAKQDRIIELMSRPAERRLVWHEYRNILVDEPRISQGVRFWEENRQALERAQQVYGVAPEIIVAIIGVETRYGRVTGNFGVVDALSTLAFDYPPRATFFRGQLTEHLLLAREEGKNPLSLKGSYAGAMGYGQFIPSSYRSFAVDFDGDGVRDIWTNKTDAIGSVANYFARHGWRGDAQTVEAVTVTNPSPELLAQANADLRPTKTVAHWRSQGVQVSSDQADDRKATLMRMQQPDDAEYWLGYEDFYVITRYNHSRLYAMAVYQLSQEILQRRAGEPTGTAG